MTKDRLWVVLGLALAILPLTAHRYGRVGDGRNYEGRWRATVSGARRGFREERAFGGSRVYWRPNVASHCRRGSRYVSRGRSGAVGAEPPSLFLSCCFGDDGVRSVFRALEGRMVSRRLRGVCGRVGCHRRRSASARSRTGRLCGSCGSARRVRRAARLGRRFAHHGMERTLWTAGCSGALPGFVSRRTRCLPAGGLRSVHRPPLVAACSGRRVLGGVQRLVHGVGVSR